MTEFEYLRQENESLKRIYEELVDSYGRLIDLFWDKPRMREDGQRGYFVKSEEYKRVLRERDSLRQEADRLMEALAAYRLNYGCPGPEVGTGAGETTGCRCVQSCDGYCDCPICETTFKERNNQNVSPKDL